MTATTKQKKELSQEVKLDYLSGFANHFETEAEANTLPVGRNSPQKVNHGLYAEQLSGSSFVAPRHENLRSWLYRIKPSVLHTDFLRVDNGTILTRPFNQIEIPPNQLRWNPLDLPGSKGSAKTLDFIQGLYTIAGNGDGASVRGSAIHIYRANRSMSADEKFFYCSDGDFLIVPEKNSLLLRTEFGIMTAAPGEIAVIPRGIKFQVDLPQGEARGYVMENYGPPFKLPGLGPIGANGLANPRDFLSPVAWYEHRRKSSLEDGQFILLNKFAGNLWQAKMDHSPLNVVAWHGNYCPYKYDLARFNVINTVSFDHPDPSIFTVLTSPSEIPGTANVDFVIFPPRWMVAEDTFRPPYYHRNVMSEYMGLIHGVYDAKQDGFVPGGGSLHNALTAHGPDRDTFDKASSVELKSVYQGNTLAFMFESSLPYAPTAQALENPARQRDYMSCWEGLEDNFHLP